MKQLIKLFLVFSIIFIPIRTYAYNFSCDKTKVSYEDKFTCRITDNKSIDYDVLMGTIPSNDYINCEIGSYDNSLSYKSVNNSFSLEGKNNGRNLVNFTCTVIKDVDKSIKSQLLIKDFTFHVRGSNAENEVNILRSQYLEISKKQEVVEVDNKIRDTSHKESRLSVVSANNLDFTFSGFVTIYNLEVLYDVSNIDLKIVPLDNDANIKIVGDQNLHVGLNVIDIHVTSANNLYETYYTLNITRLDEGEEIYYEEDDAKIKDIAIKNTSFIFNQDKYEYTLNIGENVTKLEITAIPNYEGATIVIDGNENLNNGSIIKVKAISLNKTNETTYKISIIKTTKKTLDSQTLLMLFGGIVFVLIVIIILSVRRKKRRNIINESKN